MHHRDTENTEPLFLVESSESFDRTFIIYLTFISSGAKLAFGAKGMFAIIETYPSLDEQRRWREAENGMIGRDRHA